MSHEIIIDGQGTTRRIYPDISTPITGCIKRPEITTYEEALDWNKTHQEHHQKESFLQEYARVKCNPEKTNRVLLVNVSDLHWGNDYVDYDFLDKNLSIIENTPDVKACFGWNLLDSAIPSQFPDGLMVNGQTAQEQVYSLHRKLVSLNEKGKLVAAIGDSRCHEGWLRKNAGWMVYRELFDGIDVPLLLNGGYLDLEVGEQVYRVGLFHKTRYWSTLNKGHGGERMMDRTSDSEIIFTAHMHKASTNQTQRYNYPFSKATAVVSSGTCKLKDEWLRSVLGEDGEPGFQGIMLWGDKHKFQTIFDLETGKELMK